MLSSNKDIGDSEVNTLKILTNLDIGYIKVDNDGIIMKHNVIYNKIFGYDSSADLVGTKTLDYWLNPEEREKIRKKLYKNGIVEKYIATAKRIDGKKIFVHTDIQLNKNSYGIPIFSEETFIDVTQRIMTEQKLKESGEKYRKLFESSTDGIVSTDMEGSLIDANKSFLDMLGYSKEELLKLNFRDITPPKWYEMEDNLLFKQLSEGKVGGVYEKECIRKDGTIFPINIRFWILNDEQGDPNITWAIVRDITESKKVEEIIKKSEAFLQKSQEIAQIGSFEMDLSTNEVVWSDQLYKLFGLEKEGDTIDYDKVLALIHPDDRDRAIKVSGEAARDRKPYKLEHRVIHPNGRILNLLITGDVIQDEKGEVVKIGGITQDITERKKYERRIRDLARFPSENPHSVLRVNRNRIIYINEAGQKLLKIKENSHIPLIFQESVNLAFDSNQATESEVELDDKVYSFIITPIKDSDNINIYGMDITERKHIEVKLKELNKLKSEFLRRASHELKTPLISIKGFSELTMSEYREELNPEVFSNLTEINKGCERLQIIINDLINTSRLETIDSNPRMEEEDLIFLIKYCVNELKSVIVKRGHSLNLEIHDSLIARFEKEEIHDVISNLLINAIKYTPPNGKINIRTELLDDSVIVSIRDNGIGFNQIQRESIFKQFGKIERYGQGLDLEIDGTGLGLYISKRIVESHGGKIWMESEGINKGSAFYFSIPL